MPYCQTNKFSLSSTSPSAASTAVGATITGLGSFQSLMIYLETVGATGGTLDIYLQVSPDEGTTWVDYIHLPQLTAGNAAAKRILTVSRDAQAALTTVGSGTSPALAANTIVGGEFGDRMRVVYVAGVSTSAGAATVIKILGKS